MTPEITLKTASDFAFSPNSRHVAHIGGRDVTLLNLRTRKPRIAVHPIANPAHIDFSPNGRLIVVKGTSGRTIVLRARTGDLVSDFRNQKEGEGDAALFTSCSRYVVSVAWNGLFIVREIKSGQTVFSQTYNNCQLTELSSTADRGVFFFSIGGVPRTQNGLTPCRVAFHKWPSPHSIAELLPKEWKAICGMQISPSGRFLALVHGTPPNILEIYDIKNFRTFAKCAWSGGLGCSIAWTRDDEKLFVTGDDCFRMYTIPKLKVIQELPIQYTSRVRISPDEKFLALGSWKRSCIIPWAGSSNPLTDTT
jgi:WD40 repeat protein